ncbi:GNAT family N-acetyltransferase [Lactiplantibacillus mudanjiangensis]|uniref:GNAT family N-acetyltransferase [Lactobacillus sp.] n=1 Tax=Lactiplantibacillus mudanjiangensis TaxID=1296538 RepID=A0A660E3Q4_9LACO|nr:GNAT family N-acetyltransferase [Lactiplantibacillus mudanjiangensis]VDG25391.1 GNAT family N-acetyltransferase [Lactobacillus sp.] [Lactiplantibacillus mudanjiangensis]VDG27577.1 GNAT family N-acetyltransferase [Lactobacillus sp.] [Lactiplantibacillus mudanjiangensis]
MTENLRLTTDTDREAFYQLYQYAFNNHDTPTRRTFFMDRYQHGWIYGLHDHDQLVSGLYSLPMKVNFHGVTYPMNGIGDVMSAPEYSGRGGAGKLLTAALNEMADNHIPLSYLAPFSYAYYRKFGYEQVFNHTQQKIAAKDLPVIKPHDFSGSITRYGNEGLALVNDFYATQPINQRGGVIREDWWLHYLTLKHDWSVAIYRNANQQIEGYLIYDRQATTFAIQEWSFSTPAAFERLANFITKHGTTFETFSYEAPSDEHGLDLLANPYSLNVQTTPYMMARIVLLHDFLKRYPFINDLVPIRLAVTDTTLTLNQGIWELSVTNGQVTCNRVTDALDGHSDLQASIQQLTKALFGTRSLTSAWQHHQITGDLAEIQRLDASLVQTKPTLIDYF